MQFNANSKENVACCVSEGNNYNMWIMRSCPVMLCSILGSLQCIVARFHCHAAEYSLSRFIVTLMIL